MMAKILKDAGEDGVTVGEMINKYHSNKKELVEDAIEVLEKSNRIYKKLCIHKYNKKEYFRIFKLWYIGCWRGFQTFLGKLVEKSPS